MVTGEMEGLTPAPAEYRELLRQKLADVTRRIQWTYSIFWTFYPQRQVLVWGEGHFNGAESTEDSLRRSRQLQEVFIAMNANRGVSQQPSAASAGHLMSPQDLTQTEWFYMCSMACSFATGAGLPGRAFARKRYVWHCVTREDDIRVVLRAHLAQRARIQTIVCIPALDGVVEFGTTALVKEDTSLLQQMQSVFSEQPTIHPARTSSTRARELPGRSKEKPNAFKEWTAVAAAPHRQQFLQSHRQRMLKTAVLTIPRLYAVKQEVNVEMFSTRAGELASNLRGRHDLEGSSRAAHVRAERIRREKLNNGFVTLRSLVPLATKSDKVSLLGDTIAYVRVLQSRVEELESNKKKSVKSSAKQHVEVNIEKSIAVFKISCAWKDGLLIDILQRMVNFQLKVVDATAKVSDGFLKATLKAKVMSSDKDIEEKTGEIQAALLSTIEEKLSEKAVSTQE
ncbi:hypothetical protein M758_3G063300 [Ceratodon purpureus]|nr:hypothetical protein M758_3G063300 [Ceratodon purpureus]KAG0621979.1 hypothetical protein M758_3G063300 [Ceratodon purpureus]